VRPAAAGDGPALGGIHVRAWQDAYRGLMSDGYLDGLSATARAGLWTRTIAAPPPGTQLWVAEREGQLVGFAGGGPPRSPDAPDALELYVLNVDPPAHRAGAGTALLEAFAAWAKQGGAGQLLLWVVRENARARAFYERRGWRADGGAQRTEVLGAPIDEVRYRRVLG
jgi:GNAT superfamily N-acetyltransferase